MSHQQAYAQQIVDNIINGNHTTARGQLFQASTECVLIVAELLAMNVDEADINLHGTPLAAAHVWLKRVSRGGE